MDTTEKQTTQVQVRWWLPSALRSRPWPRPAWALHQNGIATRPRRQWSYPPNTVPVLNSWYGQSRAISSASELTCPPPVRFRSCFIIVSASIMDTNNSGDHGSDFRQRQLTAGGADSHTQLIFTDPICLMGSRFWWSSATGTNAGL
jgi:hypothetical protein